MRFFAPETNEELESTPPWGGKTKAVTESLRARYMIPPNVAATFVLVAMVVIAG